MLVRQRHSTRDPGEVTGYAVALPGDITADGGQVWFGGGKLAADLTLPKLRQRWEPARTASGSQVPTQERNEIWAHAVRITAGAAEQVRQLAGFNPAAAADVAWATADALRVTAAALGSPALRQAADSYDRASRVPYGRIPRPTRAGNSLRTTARLLAGTAIVVGGPLSAQVTLMAQLAGLVEAVAELRQAQQRAAQAASARQAAERLHAALRAHSARRSGPPRNRASAAAALAYLDFPGPPRPYPPGPGLPRPHRPAQPTERPPRAPRPRGPTRC